MYSILPDGQHIVQALKGGFWMNRIKGFTLVELMVVIALLAIMAAIAIPNFTSLMKANRTEAQAEELNALFQYARSEAVIRKTNIEIKPDSATGKVEVLQGSTVLRTSTLNNQVTLSPSAAKLEYRPNGTANPANFSAII